MSRLPRYLSFLCLALAVVFLTGCANNVSFSAAKRASVKNAAVLKTSQYPDKDHIMIYTFGQNLAGALGGGIGAAVAAGVGADDRSQFAAFLQSQKIDPGLIMAGAFEDELNHAPLWPAQAKTASDATFEFKTGIVGLMIKHGLTTKLSPYLMAVGTLRNREGTVLWQKVNYIVDGHIRHSLDEYLQQPNVLRRALEVAARKLSREFLDDLHSSSGTDFESTAPEPSE